MRNKKAPLNPFVLTGYYGKTWFCDREEEITTLKDHVLNDRNVVMYSLRRMGKTALIQCLFDQLSEDKRLETLYVDMMATQNSQEAIRAISKAVFEKYGATENKFSSSMKRLFSTLGLSLSFDRLTGVPEISFNLKAPVKTEASLEAIGGFLAERKKRVIIALDEFQQIANYEGSSAEAIFRGWTQQFPDIRFIFCGSHRKMMTSMFSEANRPFYRSAQLLPLAPVPISEYASFINSHFSKSGKKIEDAAIEQIYEWSRGQTYSIQRICNLLFSQNSRCSTEEVRLVFEQIIAIEKPILSNYTHLLTHTQWAVLRSIGKEEPLTNPMGKDFISKYGLGAPSTVSSALKMLIKKEIVIEEMGTYYIHDVLLTRWLQSL